MKMLVVSDSHMYNDILENITNKWKNKVDLLVHCGDGSLTVVSNFSLTKSLKTLIISMLLSFFVVKFLKIIVLIRANVCYNRHRR